ncbi:MAG: hypothetical protein NVS3B5_04180 [Sphingomicrobium sp.]
MSEAEVPLVRSQRIVGSVEWASTGMLLRRIEARPARVAARLAGASMMVVTMERCFLMCAVQLDITKIKTDRIAMRTLSECNSPDEVEFAKIRDAGEPVVMRGIASTWPAVTAARRGELADYLTALATDEKVAMLRADASEHGRLHYNPSTDGPNFNRELVSIKDFFTEFEQQTSTPSPETLVIQSTPADRIQPGFSVANPIHLLTLTVEPRIWLDHRPSSLHIMIRSRISRASWPDAAVSRSSRLSK